MLTLRSLLVLALLALPMASLALEGPVRVIDGDTIDLGPDRIRLFGIDAPERGQSCRRGGVDWDCGAWSAQVLADLVRGGKVTCSRQDVDRNGRIVAICHAGGRDIAADMVAAGAAVAYRRYSQRYVAGEIQARAEAVGVWSGQMTRPEDHRHARNAARTAAPAPSGCRIKGNISASGRIYHRPGQRDYDATRISPAKGEAWFCTEAEARAAGFRPARR
jgi:endonuclease YncB( thermonuclease family)